jgi:hypothetical protein
VNAFGVIFAAWPGRKNIGQLLRARGSEQEKLAAELNDLDSRMSLLFTLQLINAFTQSPGVRKQFDKIIRDFERTQK